ncbi:hypothetical protein L1987_32464 [Smallanthus sonchifolius]|uniref:Uncharacterized protein n=1 Tax=Smallanthus sonchifolius TaxID=185202 RepID=A0ACB9HNB5_9ASTR|nr:hypothetical protein L1987_32464 [Smallanthus sonchifolius]
MGNSTQKPQQNSEYHQQDEEETFTCEICIEPVSNKFKNSNKCVHPFCTDCIIKYIQMKLQDNVSDVKCPAYTCNHSLEPLSCRPKITRQLFDKWCDVLCESCVLGVNRVYCPNRDCSELILNECGDRNLKRCECPNCKKPFCFRCKVPWHAGSTCGEMRDENDVAFDVLYKKNNWRRCPGCGRCVEHDGGCNIVQCRCTTQFCYKCGQRWCLHGLHHRAVVIACVGLVILIGALVAFAVTPSGHPDDG